MWKMKDNEQLCCFSFSTLTLIIYTPASTSAT